ncbi:MAG: rhodanese-like domain-containing protein [Desulforhopalus sp.]
MDYLSGMRILKATPYLLLLLPLFGFIWSHPSWESVNRTLAQKYSSVRHVSTDELSRSLDQNIVPIIIDVREKDEFDVSHLPNAVNITAVEEVNYPLTTKIVVYCSVGLRSAVFAEKLQERGYTEVLNLRGSIFEWANKGYRLLRGEQETTAVHPYNEKWSRLLDPQFHQYQADGL